MKYRKDINGLRAIAVLPVLFFHAQWDLFKGGFLGVDVFFVISGFLITSIIINEINQGTFSIISFYNRRARRILPALLTTLLATSVAALVFMLPYDIKNYGQSLVATILSANNVLLYLTSGYWSLASDFKPLYHTWSLAVEEQYYLIIPAILLSIFACLKNKKDRIAFATISCLFLASYFICLSSENLEFSFLIITHRMWELLAGSMCAFIYRVNERKSTCLPIVGLLLICASYVSPNALSHNQAIYALPTIIGTALIILYSSNDSPAGKLLSIKPLSSIGTASYSIYLLHMPLLAYLRLSTEGKPSVASQTVCVLASIPLAFLSVKYVENYFRSDKRIANRPFYLALSSTSIALLAVGLIMHQTYGFQSLFEQYSYGNNPQQYADTPFRLRKSEFTASALKRTLVIGDSFARDVINMLNESGIGRTHEIIYLQDLTTDPKKAARLLEEAELTLAVSSHGLKGTVDPELVAIESRELYDTLSQNCADDFYLIGTKNFGYNNNFVRQKSESELKNYEVSPNRSTQVANAIESKIWRDRYVDLLTAIARPDGKVPIFTPEGGFISFDTEHLTQEGAKYIGETLKNLLSSNGAIEGQGPNKCIASSSE